jgi:hypothetical protein
MGNPLENIGEIFFCCVILAAIAFVGIGILIGAVLF